MSEISQEAARAMLEALKAHDEYWSDQYPGGPAQASEVFGDSGRVRAWAQMRAAIAAAQPARAEGGGS